MAFCGFKLVLLTITGSIFIALGGLSIVSLPSVVKNVVYSRLALSPTSQSFPMWKNIPVPIYERYYFFNLTNPIEVERIGAKPRLNEIGPFTYQLYMNKTNIHFHQNGTVTFQERKTWIFKPEMSAMGEDEMITTLNVPLAMTLTLLQTAPSAVRVIVNLALEALTEGFFIRRTVRQLLFEGYPDTLMALAPLMNPQLTTYSNGRFAWFNKKNASDEGYYTIFTGTDGMEKYAFIERYNNKTLLPFWLSDECNSLNGSTNGELRAPLTIDNPQVVKLFHPELCRVLNLELNNTYETEASEGLYASRFILSPHTFKNSKDYPPNSCYDAKYVRPTPPPLQPVQERFASLLSSIRSTQFARQSRAGSGLISAAQSLIPVTVPPPGPRGINSDQTAPSKKRYPSGVFDISRCKYGVPIVISAPHFLHGDLYYRSVVDGLHPDPEKHQFYMDLEPSTGTTIGLAARVQINFAINKGPGFRYRNIPNIVYPVLWQEVEMLMTQSVASELWYASHAPQIVTDAASGTLFILGGFFLISVAMLAAISIVKSFIVWRNTDSPARGAGKSDDQLNNSRTVKRTDHRLSISQVC